MARYSQPFDFYQSPSSLHPKAFPEEDDISVLDDKILDSTTSPDLTSFADRRPSHRDSIWSEFSSSTHPSTSSRHNSQVSQTMFDSSFIHPSHPAASSSSYSQQQQQQQQQQPPPPPQQQQTPWSLSRESGSCTPTPGMYEHFSGGLDTDSSAPFAGGAVGPVNPISIPSYRSMAFGSSAVAMSPQSSQGWMPASTDMPDATAARPTKSPSYRHTSPLSVRRDGIRKKNARFEIPAERTLSNIDQLISQSSNDEEIKELKQQKRLLRNRQAALDSRQRKKLHTEKLEEEKKQYTQVINELEDALQSMKIREAELLREKSEWMGAQQQINQYIEGMHMEKDELIRVHTIETTDLRKKNNVLKESVEKLERQAKAPVSNEFEFENLTMDAAPWDDFGISMDTDSAMVPVNNNNNNKAPEKSGDSPFSWNAFYMCLLFGAFIASNASSTLSSRLPQLSEEYRAESANVLKAVLNSEAPSATAASAASAPAGAPAASGAAAASLPATISGAEMAQMTGSNSLDALTMPTKQQEHEQVFALNADQYNSLTSFDDKSQPPPQQPQQQSNLQQALADMRQKAPRGTAEVYSRSLMWDRVPEKVIRDFRRMVQEYPNP